MNLSNPPEAFFKRGFQDYNTPYGALRVRLNKALWLKILSDDLITNPTTWPLVWIDLLFTTHKDGRQRYRLFVFFWKNGVPPEKAVEYVLYHGMNRNFQYDDNARRRLADAVKQTQSAAGRELLDRNNVFIIEEGRVM